MALFKGADKVINIRNNIIGIVIVFAGDKAWVYEYTGGDHIFEMDNLEKIVSVSMKKIKVTNDRDHAQLLVNNRPVFENLEVVVKEKLDAVEKFLL